MTIAAGFVCRNGLVLCADTEYTGSTKHSGAKLWARSDGPLGLAIVGAGDPVLIRLARDRIHERVTPDMNFEHSRAGVAGARASSRKRPRLHFLQGARSRRTAIVRILRVGDPSRDGAFRARCRERLGIEQCLATGAGHCLMEVRVRPAGVAERIMAVPCSSVREQVKPC